MRHKNLLLLLLLLAGTNLEFCPMCHQRHPLYRCEVFKSKSPRERNDSEKEKKICFNYSSSTKHGSKKCKSSSRCRIQSCGKIHQTLLHYTELKEGANRKGDNANNENALQSPMPEQGASRASSNAAAASSREV